jgi:hypothetical protein
LSISRVSYFIILLAILGGLSAVISCSSSESGNSGSPEASPESPAPSEIPGPMEVTKIVVNDVGSMGIQVYVEMKPNDDTEYGVWYPVKLIYDNHIVAETKVRFSINQAHLTALFSVGRNAMAAAGIRGGDSIKYLFSVDFGLPIPKE